ncbi:hypothetical protein C7974DRAFT_397989 [Boeremia exigua]|uniref:uncharacterized protein n=1 Tax=Boeremia exigua TaxID=749465 RepID=UPI001E8D6D84|nr:uncharacterized protein C7974DRAFT_397989 [Boeremia exigua]KAH6622269.1 hypothetical protein C7974DRAFT_397989 [Boeremia exigua]
MNPPNSLITVCSISLASLEESAFLRAPSAAIPKRYRFLDCKLLVEKQLLQIYEISELSNLDYTAVSYVWRGQVPKNPHLEDASFHVEGTFDENGRPEDKPDPISLRVLRHACTASIHQGCNLLWLDRLCILQSNKEDKKWQIRNMYGIYKSCKSCIVLAGGLHYLVPLQTATAWIHRSWTLQECLAPQKTLVLFAWSDGPGAILAGDEHHNIEEIIPSESAISSLPAIVDGCSQGFLEFQPHPADWHKSGRRVSCNIFGSQTPNVLALGAALSETLGDDPDARYSSIWQCALMRTSSRPVDMVLSIMGIFGVSLDPGAFDENDRLRATVALAREILSSGGRACWLGISLTLPLSSEISTFPAFPETTVQGKAMVHTPEGKKEVAEMMEGCYPNSLGLRMPLPQGSMDESGALTAVFKFARAAPIDLPNRSTFKPRSVLLDQMRPEEGQKGDVCLGYNSTLSSIGRHSWRTEHPQCSDAEKEVLARCGNGESFVLSRDSNHDLENQASDTFALIFGWFNEYYPGATTATKRNNIRGMLVRDDAPNRFRAISFFSIDRKWRDWAMLLDSREFCIGGRSHQL